MIRMIRLRNEGYLLACELVRECGKDILEFLSVEVIPRTEEAGTEGTILCDSLGEGLGNGRLPCSGQPVEPEDVSLLWISSPSHYSVEDRLSGPAEARVVVTSLVSSVIHGTQLSHQVQVCGFLVIVSTISHVNAIQRVISQ